MKLFAIYIGGEHERANIELHDMRFIVARSIRDTYPALRQQWWGIPKSLHIDCWAELDQVDGYDVTLRPEPFAGLERLYYVNLGGYAPGEFAELHKNMFIVADSLAKAKARALQGAQGWSQAHRDDVYEAEQAFELASAAADQHLFIHLTRADQVRELAVISDYIPIRVRPPH